MDSKVSGRRKAGDSMVGVGVSSSGRIVEVAKLTESKAWADHNS